MNNFKRPFNCLFFILCTLCCYPSESLEPVCSKDEFYGTGIYLQASHLCAPDNETYTPTIPFDIGHPLTIKLGNTSNRFTKNPFFEIENVRNLSLKVLVLEGKESSNTTWNLVNT